MKYFTLGSAALGTIEPQSYQQERLNELTQRLLSDEFYVKTDEKIPSRCIDGRSPKEGFTDFIPNAAGGTETLFIADELVTRRFSRDGSDTAADYARLLTFLKEQSCRCGGHRDDRSGGTTSGCGANDKLPAIMAFIAEHGDDVRWAAEALGVGVPKDMHDAIVERAQYLSVQKRYANGAEILRVLKEKTNNVTVDTLTGDHHEVMVIVNMRAGTTLDRGALMREFGEMYEVFNVDVWSFGAAAQLISVDDAVALELAMVYYNIATAYALGGAHLPVLLRPSL